MLGMIQAGTTHLGVATDQVIESFRNDLWPGYKTGAGIDPALYSQFPILEEALAALGMVVWPMVEYEADDALAPRRKSASRDPRVARVIICTPDKDLAQSVRGTRVVQMDRRARTIRDEAGVIAKFGVPPASIPDYLALVGDTSDGYPGLAGWGAKSAAAVLAKFGHLESIPADWTEWKVNATRAGALAATLDRERHLALLFRDLATLRTDIPLFKSVDELAVEGSDTFVCRDGRATGHEFENARRFAKSEQRIASREVFHHVAPADPAASPKQLVLEDLLVAAVDRLRQGYGASAKALATAEPPRPAQALRELALGTDADCSRSNNARLRLRTFVGYLGAATQRLFADELFGGRAEQLALRFLPVLPDSHIYVERDAKLGR